VIAELLQPIATEPSVAALLLYPTAVEKFPLVVFFTPTAVVSLPTVVQAEIVPVIAPVPVFNVAPVALFKIPKPTEASPPVLEKFSRPNICELRAQEMLR
jgi:hypothetical protein